MCERACILKSKNVREHWRDLDLRLIFWEARSCVFIFALPPQNKDRTVGNVSQAGIAHFLKFFFFPPFPIWIRSSSWSSSPWTLASGGSSSSSPHSAVSDPLTGWLDMVSKVAICSSSKIIGFLIKKNYVILIRNWKNAFMCDFLRLYSFMCYHENALKTCLSLRFFFSGK